VQAAQAVLEGVVKTYEAPQSALKERSADVAAHDILRVFADTCRAELEGLR
jgi:hypothetical protein